MMLCFLVFGCQYQCNQLPAKICLQNDLLCVKWNVKPYTLTHSLHCGIFLLLMSSVAILVHKWSSTIVLGLPLIFFRSIFSSITSLSRDSCLRCVLSMFDDVYVKFCQMSFVPVPAAALPH